MTTKNTEREELALTISTKTFLRIAFLTVGVIVLMSAARKASHSLLLIFIAFFLALALNAPVSKLSQYLPGKRRGSRTLATSLSFLIVVILIGAFLASIVPSLVKQTNSFVKAAPSLVEDFRSQDSATGKLIRKYNLEDQTDKVADELSARLKNAGGAAFSTIQRVGSSIFSLVTILVLTFMMLVEGPAWLKLAKQLVPKRHHEMAERMSYDMYRVVKGFVNGQVTLAAIAAVVLLPALLVLGISYPIALMVIVFICGLIPLVGHTIGAVIIFIVALFTSTTSAVFILAYYILYQQIENYTLQPKIQANSTNMSPLLVFMAVVIGISFGGLAGGLFAIPLAGCIRIVVLEGLRSRGMIDTPTYKEVTTNTK